MSGGGSPLRRGAMAATIREHDRQVIDEARRAEWLASTYGPCATCKRDVGPDGIHEWSCTRVPTDRRENKGRPS